MWMEKGWYLSYFSIHTLGSIAFSTLVIKLGTFVSKEGRILLKVFNLQWACPNPMELREYFGKVPSSLRAIWLLFDFE